MELPSIPPLLPPSSSAKPPPSNHRISNSLAAWGNLSLIQVTLGASLPTLPKMFEGHRSVWEPHFFSLFFPRFCIYLKVTAGCSYSEHLLHFSSVVSEGFQQPFCSSAWYGDIAGQETTAASFPSSQLFS